MVFFELFAHNPTIIHVAAGQPLFSEGEEGHMMFVLSTGTANVMVSGHVLETLQHGSIAVSYTHLRAHETVLDLVCRLLLEKKKKNTYTTHTHYIK